MIIHRNKSYVIVVSLLKCLIILYSPFFLWWCKMIKCLCDGIKWSNESALWPSVRLLLTFWPYIRRRIAWFRRSWIMEPGWLEVSCRRCWRLEILARDLIILLRMHANWNLRIVYFWDFLFHTFGPKVTETVEKETKGNDYCKLVTLLEVFFSLSLPEVPPFDGTMCSCLKRRYYAFNQILSIKAKMTARQMQRWEIMY